jgi:DUF4097 and DUF4098 domain-containing protein YvlB
MTSVQEPTLDDGTEGQTTEPEPGGSLAKAIGALFVAAIVVTGVGAYFILQALSVDELNYTESFSEEYPADANTTLRVSTVSGYIIIVGWSNDVINISGVKRATYEEDLDKIDLEVTVIGDEITLEVTHATNRGGLIDLDLRVPHDVTIETLHSTNGEIDVSDMSVVREVETINGAISLEIPETDGGVELSSTNGRIDCYLLETLDVTVEVTTVNGWIDISDIALSLTIDESTHKRGDLGSGGDLISMSTTNGAIQLHGLT